MYRIFTFLLLVLGLNISAQNISVSSFEQRSNDLDARVNFPVKDQNGDLCALLKIATTETDFVFEGGQLGIMKTEKKTGEYWVYIPYGSKRITIKHNQLGNLYDYTFPETINKATVYLMKLTTGKVTIVVEDAEILTEWIVITSTPENAQVYIDDKPVGYTPFSGEYQLGEHNYRIELPMYHNNAGVFSLDANTGKQKVEADLKPNFGSIYVTSSPESGADVLMDGKPTGKTTPCEINEVMSGKHNITIKLNMYYDSWQEVTVSDDQKSNLGLTMKPAFGELDITTNPVADIYINGSKVGSGSIKERKTSGFYTVEARKEKHTSDSKKIEVTDGETITIELTPTPQYGTLKINSNPPEAYIYIDGVKKGTTPITLRKLLVGEYNLELKKETYATYIGSIEIKHNEITEITEKLVSGANPYEIESKDPFLAEMVYVEGGTFTMGCTSKKGSDCSEKEKPIHKVTLSDYYIGKYEVTQRQWQAIMGVSTKLSNPSYFSNCDSCPVENISWEDIQVFLSILNKKTSKTYRLPTEAEWEYAARGGISNSSGTATKYLGSDNISYIAWYLDNSSNRTHPVGRKAPNDLGIYDMSGNVWEWCSDWYGDYSSSRQTNPKGSANGSNRVLRGGGWNYSPRYCRVSYRNGINPEDRGSNCGFRLVLEP